MHVLFSNSDSFSQSIYKLDGSACVYSTVNEDADRLRAKGFLGDFDNSLQIISRFRSDDERIDLECLQDVSSLLNKLI
jgi:hypothetical protein